jgi:hypothetical protein
MLQLQLPGKLLFLFRIRFGLYAVLARLGAKLDWQALEEEFRSGADAADGSVPDCRACHHGQVQGSANAMSAISVRPLAQRAGSTTLTS